MTNQQSPHILHIEDNPIDALAFGLLMQTRAKVTLAARLSAGIQHRNEGTTFEYIFLDLTLPDSWGPNAIAELSQTYPDTPIVVLSELEEPDWEVQSLQNGAVEVISKKEHHRMELDSFFQRIQTRQQIQRGHREKCLHYEQMLKTVAHEIRTPLTGLLGFARLLEGTALNDIQAEYVQSIWESSHNMLCLVNDLLDHNRFHSGRLEICHRTFRLADLLEQSLKSVRSSCALKNLKLELKIDPALPHLARGDDLRIGQVLSNLLGNAIKFTDHGGIVLACNLVEGKTSEGGKIGVRFTVEDSGRGISRQSHAEIFNEFQQSHPMDSLQGYGIGLHLSRQIVHSMGGEIALESSQGVGSKFMFTIPLIALKPPENHYGVMKMLVVDDDRICRSLVKTVVNQYGIETEEADTAIKALELASKTSFALVLLDLELPDSSGLKVLEQLRKQGYSGVILALSGHSNQEIETQALQLGADEYLVKPLEPEMIRSHLECWVDKPQALDRQRLFTLKQLACRPSAAATVYQVIENFLSGAASELEQILDSSQKGLEQDTLRLAHLFKGSCATVGAYELVKMLQEIEESPASGPLLQSTIEFKLSAALHELQIFLRSLKGLTDVRVQNSSGFLPESEPEKVLDN